MKALLARLLGLALRLSDRKLGIVLVYHAVAERTGDPRRELVPPHGVALLEAQVRLVRSRYRLVRAEDVLDAAAARRRGGRFPVAITFDDDLASHVELAAPLLGRLGAPATFFLTGATLAGPAPFWWQRLAAGDPKGEDLLELARRLEGMPAEQRDAVVSELGAEPDERGLRADDVRGLIGAGFDVGFHTLRHDRLPDLADRALEAALVDGRDELEAAVGRPLRAIAYPHGKADARVARAAEAAGFELGFTGAYEPVRAGSDPLLVGRIEPTHASAERLGVQLVGVLRRGAQR